ncbi:MAG TPA: hypothetical protein VJT82_06170 [Pyrinomonadaceae bacterium]|nr:hypothetical protein [Pyrinomonadaceae bacterium]
MQLVYATGQPSNMEFGITGNLTSVPSDGVVYAKCVGEKVDERLDESTFAAMTDGEFYDFKRLVLVARQRESERARARKPSLVAHARNLLQNLLQV